MQSPVMRANVPVLGFAAASGTGKTTLLCALIPRLKARGLRVGLIKHAHHTFEVDQPGKDSYELRKAGACPVLITSQNRRVVLFDHAESREPDLWGELRFLDTRELDLVLVEGFKREVFPKIELYRTEIARHSNFQVMLRSLRLRRMRPSVLCPKFRCWI